jgi:hypothetical protein
MPKRMPPLPYPQGPQPGFPTTVNEALAASIRDPGKPIRPTPVAQRSSEERLAEARRLHRWAELNGGVVRAASLDLEGVTESGARLRCKVCGHAWEIPTSSSPTEMQLLCPAGRCNRHAVTDEDMRRPG